MVVLTRVPLETPATLLKASPGGASGVLSEQSSAPVQSSVEDAAGWSYDDLPVAVLAVDYDLRVRRANAAWRDLALETAPPPDGSDWLKVFEADDRPRISSQLGEAMRTGGRATVQARIAATGRWFELRADAARRDPKQAGLVVVVLDIRGHKAREAALAFDALHDPLTGLHNRIALLERTEQALTRLDRSPSVLAVAFIDLDRFKEVNDRHGHGVGDRVLMAVGRRLAGAVRPADTLARMGGDEFVVLCEGLDAKKEVFGVAQRLVRAVGRPFPVSPSITVRLGATVGIAFAHGHRDLASDLIHRADLAMYRAKEQGWESAMADVQDVSATAEVASIDLAAPTTIDGHRCIRLDEAGSAR